MSSSRGYWQSSLDPLGLFLSHILRLWWIWSSDHHRLDLMPWNPRQWRWLVASFAPSFPTYLNAQMCLFRVEELDSPPTNPPDMVLIYPLMGGGRSLLLLLLLLWSRRVEEPPLFWSGSLLARSILCDQEEVRVGLLFLTRLRSCCSCLTYCFSCPDQTSFFILWQRVWHSSVAWLMLQWYKKSLLPSTFAGGGFFLGRGRVSTLNASCRILALGTVSGA